MPESESMLKKQNILLVWALFIGLLFNYLFSGKPTGVSFPIFTVAFYLFFILNMKGLLQRRERAAGWLLLIPVLALSATYAIYAPNFFWIINFLLLPALIVFHTEIIFAGGASNLFSIGRLISSFANRFGFTLAGFFISFSVVGRSLRQKGDKERFSVLKKILVGIIIAVPFLLLVIYLLSSADQVFAYYFKQIAYIQINVSLGDVLLVILIAFLSFGFVFSFWKQKEREEQLKAKMQAVEANAPQNQAGNAPVPEIKKWDPITVLTFLLLLNAVYAVFAAIQFSYLFGVSGLALPAGYTYAEYARRGFFELIVVSVLNFGMLLIVIGAVCKKNRVALGVIQGLLVLMAISTAVILTSAHLRLSLYEQAYGFTFLRVIAHVFMAYIAGLLIISLVKIFRYTIKLNQVFFIVSAVFYLAINYANIDGFIARKNIDRYLALGKLDQAYLLSLSNNAAPQLARLLDDEDRIIAGAIRADLNWRRAALPDHWQSFNLADYRLSKIRE
ncbi:MAG: DUF4173 domain-containing protein [Bacillota bacterium]